jgi:hypothetical protein
MHTCIWYEYSYSLGFTLSFCGFDVAEAIGIFRAYDRAMAGMAVLLLGKKKTRDHPRLHYSPWEWHDFFLAWALSGECRAESRLVIMQ